VGKGVAVETGVGPVGMGVGVGVASPGGRGVGGGVPAVGVGGEGPIVRVGGGVPEIVGEGVGATGFVTLLDSLWQAARTIENAIAAAIALPRGGKVSSPRL
jgi:hypothetical protein